MGVEYINIGSTNNLSEICVKVSAGGWYGIVVYFWGELLVNVFMFPTTTTQTISQRS